MGLLSGRSKPARRKVRSDHESRVSRRQRARAKDEEAIEVEKPDLDELRQRRAAYYGASPKERKKIPASSPMTSASRRSTSTALRSSSESQRRHKRRPKSESSRPDNDISDSRRRTEDYVYGSQSTENIDLLSQATGKDGPERPRSDKRRSRHSSSRQRRSLPTVLESEVTPDDSISQVAERDAPERAMRRAHVRPSLKRSSTTSSKLRAVPELAEESTSVATSSKSPRRTSSVLGTSSRRHSTTSLPAQPRLVECLTCGSDDVPSSHSAKLACGHRMCHDCLKRIFEMSVKDPAHMPPRCCTEQHIPLKHVDKLFDVKFKTLWNRKYQEYHTKDRIYCPTLKCGEWIKPSHIYTAQGRRYAQCPRCKTKVCVLCNNRMHKSADCPKDPEIAKLVEQAKEKGWQRCYSCSALVERREGCNHMTCRCLAEFCILCGAKWKTCECPWFNYANLPDPDRLNNMRIPEPIRVIYRQVFGNAVNQMANANPFAPAPPPAPPEDVREPVPAPNARRVPPPEVTYQQELDERRRQERLDADLARRLQLASILEPDDDPAAGRRGVAEPLGIGNVARHFMNDDFVQNAANVVMNAFGDANLGRRGERQSGRRRRARQAEQNNGDPGLAPNFLGDESVLGDPPPAPIRRAEEA